MYWYRQIHPTSWIVYRDNQAVWETTGQASLLLWCRAHGITAVWRPLRILKIV